MTQDRNENDHLECPDVEGRKLLGKLDTSEKTYKHTTTERE